MNRELLQEVLDYFEHASIYVDDADYVEKLCLKIEAELKNPRHNSVNAALEKLDAIENWYDTDGSVGGLSQIMHPDTPNSGLQDITMGGSRGIRCCDKHGGHGFSSDCIDCNRHDQPSCG